MKDYILENQPLLGSVNIFSCLSRLPGTCVISWIRSSLAKLDDKVAKLADDMGEAVTHSELSNIMLDFSSPVVRRGWLILRG